MTATRSVGRTIKRGAVTTALGFPARLGARVLFLYVAGRLFGVALFGAYTLALAVVEVAVTIAGLGCKRILFKVLDEHGEQPVTHVVLDYFLAILAAGAVLVAGLILVIVALPTGLVSPRVATALMALAPMIIGQALLDLVLSATRWRHVLRYEVVCRSMIEPYVSVAALLAAYALGFSQSGLLISYWAGTLAALGYALIGLGYSYGGLGMDRYRLSGRRLTMLLRTSSSATINDLLNGLWGRVDMYLVGLFLGETGAGIYGMARQIRTPVRQVRQSFDALLNPIIARTIAAEGAARAGYATAAASRLILALQLPIVVALVLIGQPLLAWFGPGFVAGYWAMVVLAAAEAFQGAFSVSDLIILYRRPAAVLRITGVNIVCNIMAGWLLMWHFGVTGAAIGVLAGVLASAALRRLTLRRAIGVVLPLQHCLGPFAATLVAIAVALGLRSALAATPIVLRDGVALIAGLMLYWGCLKLWMMTAGQDWSLREFESTRSEHGGKLA